MSVHLIHVGFPKTGSTYLQHWFANHPQIEFRTGQLAGCDSVHDLVEQISSPRPRGVRVTSCQNFSMPSFEHDEWSGIPAAQSVC
jgi:hypothetical protein